MAQKIKRLQAAEDNAFSLSELHPVLNRVYRNRGITSPDQLRYVADCLLSYRELKDIRRAVGLLEHAIRQQQSLLIIGDFDADGATSTAVAVRALRRLGARSVNYLVPNRFEYGYGLTPEIVQEAARLRPDVIVTVDNGISSIQGVDAAKTAGIQVVITDHHLAGDRLPAADAIVNPNQPGDTFPSKALAGVGVIFYVMLALRAQLRATNWFDQQHIDEPNLAELLDLVALGTVADVVPLDHNNRILVAQGLARIRAGRCCDGIKALVEIAGRQLHHLGAQDLAFAVGPRLNAAGRLDDMSLGIECLLADVPDRAQDFAGQLNRLNEERKSIEHEMKTQALDSLQLKEEELPTGVCLYEQDWHQGVIGILASRVKEKYHRPVIAFADAGADSEHGQALIKGSARSIPGVHIRDVLDSIAAQHPDLLSKFGGHAMAAGLTLKKKDFTRFAAVFDEQVKRVVDKDDLQHVIHSDGELQAGEIDLSLAQLLEAGGPWGQHFPEPVFDGRFELVQRRIVGERHLKLVLKIPGGDRIVDAIAFNTVDDTWPDDVRVVDVAYKLAINEYRGLQSAQLIVDFIEPVIETALEPLAP
ncbi:MAG: single-stranded-DNA-specific exonuclease RecJ [Gammaproteobacteria bacterium]|jgi:single-stranded-DNA-specific exonuclease